MYHLLLQTEQFSVIVKYVACSLADMVICSVQSC